MPRPRFLVPLCFDCSLISAFASAAAQVSSMSCRVWQRNRALDMARGGVMDADFVASDMISAKTVTRPSTSAVAVMNRHMASTRNQS